MPARLRSRLLAGPLAGLLSGALLACDPPPPTILVVPASGAPVAPAPLSPDTQRAIASALDDITNGTPEPIPAEALAAAQDPARLLGRWQIKELRGSTNGVASAPSQPLMPTAWVFGAGGTLQVDGGMQIAATYTYTGARLVVAGVGPTLDYTVVRLTDTELEVLHRITAGDTLVIENTTVLTKVP